MSNLLPKISLRIVRAQRGISLAFKRQKKGEKLALNAQSMSSSGVQMAVRDQTPVSADTNSLKKASQPASVGNKPAATKVEEYKAKMPYPQKLRQAE